MDVIHPLMTQNVIYASHLLPYKTQSLAMLINSLLSFSFEVILLSFYASPFFSFCLLLNKAINLWSLAK
jgi:hypothetical protein